MGRKLHAKPLPTLLIVLASTAVIVIVFFLFQNSQNKHLQPTAISHQTANWKIYTNSVDKLSFRYPNNFTSATPEQPYYFLSNPIIQFQAKKSEDNTSNYQQCPVIAISSNNSTPACLLTPRDKVKMDKTEEINGITFNVGTQNGVALGNTYESTVYRTIKDNTCYEVVLTIHTTSDWNNIDWNEIEKSKDQAKQTLNQILSTFKFLD